VLATAPRELTFTDGGRTAELQVGDDVLRGQTDRSSPIPGGAGGEQPPEDEGFTRAWALERAVKCSHVRDAMTQLGCG
jgi:hypothetical protein